MASVNVKKGAISDFDSLMAAILAAVLRDKAHHQGAAGEAMTAAALQAMEVQYEDGDGDMVVVSHLTNMVDVMADAQSFFVSARNANGTRITKGGRPAASAGRQRKLLKAAEEGQGLLSEQLSEGVASPSEGVASPSPSWPTCT